uniref:Uncharacterized protein n=1 Tax=Acrobeloides nanus TaxID=290746 RepID=A0A914D2I3_9BILA
MGGEISREELDAKVEAAYYRARSEGKEEGKDVSINQITVIIHLEAQRREERAYEERERLRDEFKKERELEELKRERIQAERLMETQRLAEEKRHQEYVEDPSRLPSSSFLHSRQWTHLVIVKTPLTIARD